MENDVSSRKEEFKKKIQQLVQIKNKTAAQRAELIELREELEDLEEE